MLLFLSLLNAIPIITFLNALFPQACPTNVLFIEINCGSCVWLDTSFTVSHDYSPFLS